MPNPFAPIDRLDFDFDLPSLPSPLARADRWFNQLGEVQRIGIVLLVLLFLVAASLYCLGLGSTVILNRAEAALAIEEAEAAAQQPVVVVPTAVPVVVEPTLALPPTAAPTNPPARAVGKPTQVADFPTPIPAQLLPTIPLQPLPQQRAAAPAEQPVRPRLVAPPEPATPTPPVRGGATTAPSGTRPPAAAAPTSSGTTRGVTPTAAPARNVFATPAPAATAARPAATTAPAAKPAATTAPAAKPIFTNPIATPTPRTSTR